MNTKKVTEARLAGRVVLVAIMTLLLVVPVHELFAKDGYKEISGTIMIDNVTEGITLDIVETIVEETPEEIKGSIEVVDKGVLNVKPEEKGDSIITAFLLSGPRNGKLLFNSSGSFTYIPKTGFAGKDSFVYIVNSGEKGNIESDVSIKVKDIAGSPEGIEISYKITRKKSEKSVLNNEINKDKNKKKSPAVNREMPEAPGLAENDNEAGVDEEIEKTPEEIKDQLIAEQMKNMLKAPAPDNDDNGESTLKTAVLLKGTKNGKLLFNSDASFTYIPKTGFRGKDRFKYKVINGENSETVTAVITVSGKEADPEINYKLKTQEGGKNE